MLHRKVISCLLLRICFLREVQALSPTPPLDALLGDLLREDCSTFRKPLFMDYSIFRQGISALRSAAARDVLKQFSCLTKSAKAAALLWKGYGDAAHEVILGVDWQDEASITGAEYAATHPGQTSWSVDHPLSDVDDLLHSILHRCEGEAIGEGGHSGWDNAKYWAAGGPKQYQRLAPKLESRGPGAGECHESPRDIIYEALKVWAGLCAPQCVALVVEAPAVHDTKKHSILAEGGQSRIVRVEPEYWDPFAFIDLCSRKQQLSVEIQKEIERVQEMELKLVIHYELLQKSGDMPKRVRFDDLLAQMNQKKEID